MGGRLAPEVYAETMARLDLFLAEGLQVVYIWEHDFKEWQKEVSRRQICMSQDWGWLDQINFQYQMHFVCGVGH